MDDIRTSQGVAGDDLQSVAGECFKLVIADPDPACAVSVGLVEEFIPPVFSHFAEDDGRGVDLGCGMVEYL